jgi:hypothetical protein
MSKGKVLLVGSNAAQAQSNRVMKKIALARIDVNALRVPVNWALLALPVDIDVAT